MLTVTLVLALSAFVVTILAAINRCPLWVAVMILCVLHLLQSIPLGR